MLKSFKYVIISVLILLVRHICLGQIIAVPDTKGDTESFLKLKDGIIKKEIAYFNITGTFQTETDSFPKQKVNEIPVCLCTDTSAIFSWRELTIKIQSIKFDTLGHKLTYVDPYHQYLNLIDDLPIWGTDGNIPREKIKSVIIQNGKYRLLLPKRALKGLYEPNFCYSYDPASKEKNYCQVFQSLDKQRIYIYMQNSDGAGGYEVTWVIRNGKYFTRIVDFGF